MAFGVIMMSDVASGKCLQKMTALTLSLVRVGERP
jgi:hypothetical protein